MTDTSDTPPAAPDGAEPDPPPAATGTEATASDANDELRAFMDEYRADKKAAAEAKAEAERKAAERKRVPAPEPKPKPKPKPAPEGEAKPSPDDKPKSYGSRRWFGGR